MQQDPLVSRVEEAFSVLLHSRRQAWRSTKQIFWVLLVRNEKSRDFFQKCETSGRLAEDSNLRTTQYYILSLVCIPFFRSRETRWSYANQSYYTSLSICLSTAEPTFHLFFTKFTNWDTSPRSGLDEVPGPFSSLIFYSWSGKVPLHTDDGRGFESILARNQSTLKGLLIPSYYREFFFDFFSFHGLTSPRLPRKQIFLFLFFSINKIILYEDAEEIGILSPPKYQPNCFDVAAWVVMLLPNLSCVSRGNTYISSGVDG